MARRRRNLWGRRRRSSKVEAQGIALLLLIAGLIWLIQNFWPLLLLLAGAGIAWWIHSRNERERKIRALSLSEIDLMNGTEFELYLDRLLTFHGYQVTHTGAAGDQGCDLLLQKDGRRIACQAKRYRKRVTNDAVAEAVASKAYHGCDDAMVIASSSFTKGARVLAEANRCRLIDREELAEMIATFQAAGAVPLKSTDPSATDFSVDP
jgi:restriction system protein